jgi:hypothetical protein
VVKCTLESADGRYILNPQPKALSSCLLQGNTGSLAVSSCLLQGNNGSLAVGQPLQRLPCPSPWPMCRSRTQARAGGRSASVKREASACYAPRRTLRARLGKTLPGPGLYPPVVAEAASGVDEFIKTCTTYQRVKAEPPLQAAVWRVTHLQAAGE